MSKARRPNPIRSFINRGESDDQAAENETLQGEMPGTLPNGDLSAAQTVQKPTKDGEPQESGKQIKQGKPFGSGGTRSIKTPFKTEVPPDLLEAVKNAAYWRRERMAWITETALRAWLAEAVAANGGPFEPRPEDLPTGRPMK